MKHDTPGKVNPHHAALIEGRLHDPFAYLGLHQEFGVPVFRAYHPHASRMWLQTPDGWTELQGKQGLFLWRGENASPPGRPCRLRIEENGHAWETVDPYTFSPVIGEEDLFLFNQGRLLQAYRHIGARRMTWEGVEGVFFAVWAPNAERVSVVGNSNGWDGRRHPMRARGSSGMWELFIPGLQAGDLYKFELRNRDTGHVFVKTDPYARAYELRPGTAARVAADSPYCWQDGAWLEERARFDWQHGPINIYELHFGSWQRKPDGSFHSYRELADTLVPYIQEMGYTHIELMPISEHPLDESWGYQATGYFAPTSRYGSPEDFKVFVDACHRAGVGVILDWVPAHFPTDSWALARFDGTALYEHEDPRLGFHQDWGTHIFNYGRHEVQTFLLASAHYWLAEFHIDGLRVDAVASMLYLDYSRKNGEWIPNKYGGRENIDAIEFLRSLNVMVHEEFPGALTFAEESTAWPMVSRPAYVGGLGFSMKWNMGWMNDTLSYMEHEPIHRRFHHNQLTFGQLYAYTENFVLPFSHDEVVHGKRSLLDKMPGDGWQKFANLRLLLSYQMTHPGKKLNFMGNEIAQGREWNVGGELDWWLLEREQHQGVKRLARDLNHLYRQLPALHSQDFQVEGFNWIDCHDADQSIISYLRWGKDGSFVVVALNFTPVPRSGYRIGVPQGGHYREVFNSDSSHYGGSNLGNGEGLESEELGWMCQPHSLVVTLPPLAAIVLQRR